MRFIRLLLICLTLVIALVAVLAIVAFTPVVQTWIVEKALARHSGLQASVGSVSAGFSRVRVTDLRLEADGAVLTLPALEAGLPLKTALWDRKLQVRSLVAKGWTLDLTRRPVAGEEEARASVVAAPAGGGGLAAAAQADAVPAQKAARIVRDILGGRELPCDASLDGVDLEGDVLIATPPGKEPARVHVIVKGGGMAAGHGGDFALDAAGPVTDPRLPPSAVVAHGRLVVAMGSPRTLNRIEFKGKLSSEGGSLPEDLSLSAGIAAAGGTGEEICTLDLSRGSRHLATVTGSLPKGTRRFAGTWKIDLRDSDLARFFPSRPLPIIAAAGEGRFDADTAFARVHAAGRLNAAASHLGVLAPAFDGLGAMTLEAGFDLSHSGQSIRVEHLDVSLAGTRPVAVVQSVQPFSLDEKTGNLKLTDPSADWLAGSFQGFPLAWLAGLADGLAFAGSDATGDFVVNAANGGFALRSKAPLVATGVSVQRAGRMLGQGLDLSLSLLADYTPQGWHVQGAPLTVGSAGRRLATIEAKVSPSTEARRRFAIAGTWNADLETLASQPAIPGLSWIKGRSATGDFSASVGTATDVKGTINVIGHAPDHTLTVSLRALVDAYGGVAFHAPVRIAIGPNASEFSADGTWTKEKAGTRVEVELTGVNVALEHLGLLAASLPAAGGVSLPAILVAAAGGPQRSASVRDEHPFWRDWVGHVKIECYRLRVGAHEVNEVAGRFVADHGSLRLEGGRGVLAPDSQATVDRSRSRPAKGDAPRSVATVEGSISFDAAAEFPYSIKAHAAVDVVDAVRLFGAPQSGHDPVVEGRFSVTDTLTGNGINLENLVGRRQEEFRLTGKGGIIRLLKTSVAASIPEAPSPVSDALVNVGSVVGSLFGIKGGSLSSGKNSLSKAAEAVLDFTYQIPEIRYDEMTVTAIRGADRTIRVAEIAMSAPNERLTGSGQIAYVKGLPLRAQPLSVELQFGARGAIAGFLSTAGLLSSDKDDQGYTMLRQPIHFGGTLEHIDESQWHDLLVKAATQTPDRGKKGG